LLVHSSWKDGASIRVGECGRVFGIW